MQSHYISHNNSTIHYRQFGTGSKLLFCFHGYGREGHTFSILERKLGATFTIIAIDIPFHGLTVWKDELEFKPQYLVGFMHEIIKELAKDKSKISLLGFSMGGRVALYLTQLLPKQVEKLVLLAPDGLSFNFWRWAASETWLGSKLLHFTIHHPGWFNWVVSKAEKWQVIHRSLADFVRYYIYDEDHRKTLYYRWISMRKFKPAPAKLKRLIKENNIPVRMLFGAFDKIIPYKGGQRFRQDIEEYASLEVVEAGHNLLSEANVRKIVQLIND